MNLFKYIFNLGVLYVLLCIAYLETKEDQHFEGSKVLEALNIGYFDYGKLFLITLPILALGIYLVYVYSTHKKYIKLTLVSLITLFIFFSYTVPYGLLFIIDRSCPSMTTLCHVSNKVFDVYTLDINFFPKNVDKEIDFELQMQVSHPTDADIVELELEE